MGLHSAGDGRKRSEIRGASIGFGFGHLDQNSADGEAIAIHAERGEFIFYHRVKPAASRRERTRCARPPGLKAVETVIICIIFVPAAQLASALANSPSKFIPGMHQDHE